MGHSSVPRRQSDKRELPRVELRVQSCVVDGLSGPETTPRRFLAENFDSLLQLMDTSVIAN